MIALLWRSCPNQWAPENIGFTLLSKGKSGRKLFHPSRKSHKNWICCGQPKPVTALTFTFGIHPPGPMTLLQPKRFIIWLIGAITLQKHNPKLPLPSFPENFPKVSSLFVETRLGQGFPPTSEVVCASLAGLLPSPQTHHSSKTGKTKRDWHTDRSPAQFDAKGKDLEIYC